MIDLLAHDREDGRLIETVRPLRVEEPTDAQADPIEAEGGEAGAPIDPADDPDPGDGPDGAADLGAATAEAADGAGDGPEAGEPVAGEDGEAPASWTLAELGEPVELPEDVEDAIVAGNDFRIIGAPTISLDTFTSVLRQGKSPAVKEAAGMYNAAVKYGVDPAILLAIMKKESALGRLGIAVGRNNGWGLRWYASYADLGGVNKGGWASFGSWTRGAEAASRLLAGGLYGKSKGYNTARRFPFRWAPASDGNAPRKYGAQLVAMLRSWGAVPGVTTGNLGGGVASAVKPAKAAKASTSKVKGRTGKAAASSPAPVGGDAPALQSGVAPIIIVGAIALGIVLLLVVVSRRGSAEG